MTGSKFPQPPGEATPDWVDVRQTDQETMHAVPVRIDGFTPVWSLPAKRGTNAMVGVDTLTVISQPNELIPADPRLKRVWIGASIGTVVVGTQAQVMSKNGPVGFTLPTNLPMPWEGFEEPLYGVAGGPGVVSLRYEYWSD